MALIIVYPVYPDCLTRWTPFKGYFACLVDFKTIRISFAYISSSGVKLDFKIITWYAEAKPTISIMQWRNRKVDVLLQTATMLPLCKQYYLWRKESDFTFYSAETFSLIQSLVPPDDVLTYKCNLNQNHRSSKCPFWRVLKLYESNFRNKVLVNRYQNKKKY